MSINTVRQRISQPKFPQIVLDTSDTTTLLYRLLEPDFKNKSFVTVGGASYAGISPISCPFIYAGPDDPVNNSDYTSLDTWKVGPVNFSWDDTNKVWNVSSSSTATIHHHMDNTLTQGGIAYAYFFR